MLAAVQFGASIVWAFCWFIKVPAANVHVSSPQYTQRINCFKDTGSAYNRALMATKDNYQNRVEQFRQGR